MSDSGNNDDKTFDRDMGDHASLRTGPQPASKLIVTVATEEDLFVLPLLLTLDRFKLFAVRGRGSLWSSVVTSDEALSLEATVEDETFLSNAL